ncbi:MAG TPA: DUF2058 domain-containing protein [Steroidobacteraceae bacterium]|jgi:hypothetical protein|nr:DUF2058 domain-containing protein [Steroidobacteraceae bacterium]
MSMSLRDQLLQAGLVNERQAKETERQLRQQQRERQQLPKEKRATASEAELASQRAQLAKTTRDQELSRQQKEQADKKSRRAQIEQLIQQYCLPRPQTDERYNFADGNKIRSIPADHFVRERLSRGEIAIVRRNGGYELVPAEIAARIRERDQHAVIGCGVTHDAAPTDDVPDDLMW